MWGNHFRRAPRVVWDLATVDSAGQCGSAGASPSPLEGKAVQCTEGSKWVINRERGEKNLIVVCRVGFVWGWACPSPFLQKSKAPHNKVDELACSRVCWEIKVYTCHPAILALPDGAQKTPSTDQPSVIMALTPSVCNPNQCLGGTSGNRVQSGTLGKTRPAL